MIDVHTVNAELELKPAAIGTFESIIIFKPLGGPDKYDLNSSL